MLFFKFIFQGWPETAALIFVAFAIVGYKPNLRESLSYSFFLVTIIYLFRILPVSFGLHTIVGVIALVLIICKVTKVSLGTSFLTAFSTMFLLAFLETGSHQLIKNLIGNVSMDQGWYWIMIGWPHVVSLVGVGIIIRKIRPIAMKKIRWLNEQ
ncbi:hypothetical protein [Desulforamulus aeronauticus]|uniref:Uncharacterized protein n=1 Tax=Desulforamulus aeronauticus DSM 10349 TaxID=1121421 RepID=A0A1M6SHR6_9FIRM|nr:hypothetical protein [Desulforamulus aeronauticus]SHK44147.1 hypothetical protein SAMN02745123_01887 [Desulforamulus aeronauticus DSM 10349]